MLHALGAVIRMTAGELAAATGGRLAGADADTCIDGPVVIDSRDAAPGSLFVCLRGERTDGHDHVADAVARGAVVCLADRPVPAAAVVVPDPVAALGRVARVVLARAAGCAVTGVTGSSGKTTTKDLLAAVLATDGPTVAPVASYNNEVGLPLTVTRVRADTRHLVLEYSARGVGHIAALTALAPPSVAVVLNVGSAHLGEFGSREQIARAKGELVAGLPADGTAVLCADDPLVAGMAARTAARVLSFGRDPGADVAVERVELDDRARPRLRVRTPAGTVTVALRIAGAHQAGNAAAAIAVAVAHGIDPRIAADALGRVDAVSPHRMHVGTRSDGLLVVDDAYNANPESMRAALDALSRLADARGGRRWAVLGEMRELGPTAAALHRQVGRYAAERGVDRIVAVGPAAGEYVAGAREVGDWPGEPSAVPDAAAAARLVAGAVDPHDAVLVKASNAARLWQVAEALLAEPT